MAFLLSFRPALSFLLSKGQRASLHLKQRLRGFTIVEAIMVLAITASLSTMLLVSALPVPNEALTVEKEAATFVQWMKHRFIAASMEHAEITIYLTKAETGTKVTLNWVGGEKDLTRESYEAEKARLEFLGGNPVLKYDGKWNTLSPAASFRVSSRSTPGERLYIKISGSGYMSISKNL